MRLPRILKKILPSQLVYNLELKSLHKIINSGISIEEWQKKGCPLPPPDTFKREILKQYAQQYNATVFIETGTFMGDTTLAMKDFFSELHTIEFDQKIYEKAKNRFIHENKITVWQGDGGEILPHVLQQVSSQKTCLFWLDGHYSGSVTGKSTANTSVIKELEAIYYAHGIHHTILIDDARLFTGHNDYPTIAQLKNIIKKISPAIQLNVEYDIIRITPSI